MLQHGAPPPTTQSVSTVAAHFLRPLFGLLADLIASANGFSCATTHTPLPVSRGGAEAVPLGWRELLAASCDAADLR
jgi:hypothetical protein